MQTAQLFNVMVKEETPTAPPSGSAAPVADGKSMGVFTAAQSTVTFGLAPGLVTLIANVLGAVFPDFEGSKLLILILSLLIGVVIYLQSASPMDNRSRALAVALAVINSFIIAATALGLDTAVANASAGNMPTAPTP